MSKNKFELKKPPKQPFQGYSSLKLPKYVDPRFVESKLSDFNLSENSENEEFLELNAKKLAWIHAEHQK